MSNVTIKDSEPEKSVDPVYDKRMNEMEAVIMEIKNKIGEGVLNNRLTFYITLF